MTLTAVLDDLGRATQDTLPARIYIAEQQAAQASLRAGQVETWAQAAIAAKITDPGGQAGQVLTRTSTGWTAATPASGGGALQASIGSGFTKSLYLPYGSSATNAARGVIYYVPWVSAAPVTLDRVMITVGTGTPGASVRLGLYGVDPITTAATLLSDWGLLPATSGGQKVVMLPTQITLAAWQVIWIAVMAQGAAANVWFEGIGLGPVRGRTLTPGNNEVVAFSDATGSGTDRAFPATTTLTSLNAITRNSSVPIVAFGEAGI